MQNDSGFLLGVGLRLPERLSTTRSFHFPFRLSCIWKEVSLDCSTGNLSRQDILASVNGYTASAVSPILRSGCIERRNSADPVVASSKFRRHIGAHEFSLMLLCSLDDERSRHFQIQCRLGCREHPLADAEYGKLLKFLCLRGRWKIAGNCSSVWVLTTLTMQVIATKYGFVSKSEMDAMRKCVLPWKVHARRTVRECCFTRVCNLCELNGPSKS